jgi:hypothetical protein
VKNKNLRARTLTVKIKYHDFEQFTRSQTAGSERALEDIGPAMRIIRCLLKNTEIH